MEIEFKLLSIKESPSSRYGAVVQLSPSNWDDYSFKTSFSVSLNDAQGKLINLGNIKIGYKGQEHGWTKEAMLDRFPTLPEGWFSLGQDVEYYKNLHSKLSDEFRQALLVGLRDVVVK
ncbi:MAG: hypothetical protein Q7K57_44850 [Burkholderiaceae bacterium]|nr:hypothetical protein [Burkholderiaceae bacterium]